MLPSNPRGPSAVATAGRSAARQPRTSARVGRADDDAYADTRSGRSDGSQTLRPHRSTGNLRRSEVVADPMPTVPRVHTKSSSQSSSALPASRRMQPMRNLSTDSSASSFSSGSSLFGRRQQSSLGSSSSRTSLEDEGKVDYTAGKLREGTEKGATGNGPTFSSTDEAQGLASYGYSLWNRVAAAATSLTDNVNLTWASSIVSGAEEESMQPGTESHLTRVMKAYYIGKARDRSDLPSWLFDERERRVERPTALEDNDDASASTSIQDRSINGPRKGLRDIYASAAAESSTPRSSRAGADESRGGPPSKASDRLKALRDAKRQASAGRANSLSGRRVDDDRNSESDGGLGRDPGGSTEIGEVQPHFVRPRVGLPTGPRRR